MPGHPMRRREFMRSAATLALAAAGYPKLVLKSLANESKSTIAFENVIGSSGIQFILENGRQTRKYQPETMAGVSRFSTTTMTAF